MYQTLEQHAEAVAQTVGFQPSIPTDSGTASLTIEEAAKQALKSARWHCQPWPSIEAEDVAQDVMVKLLEQDDNGTTFTKRTIGRLVRWTIIDATRRTYGDTRYVDPREEASVEVLANVAARREPAEVTEAWKELRRKCITGLLEHGSAQQAEVMALWLHGNTGPEIAERLGVKWGTVKVQLYRARKVLLSLYPEYCKR